MFITCNMFFFLRTIDTIIIIDGELMTYCVCVTRVDLPTFGFGRARTQSNNHRHITKNINTSTLLYPP